MYKKIMVPLDGSELAECILPHVKEFTTDCKVNTIVFVRVIESASTFFPGADVPTSGESLEKFFEFTKKAEEESFSNADMYLNEVIKGFKQGEVRYRKEILIGKVEDRLLEYAEANNIELILIATHGRSGASRWVRGSVADRILRGSRIPVLMVRAPGTIGLS